jgi:hypothetical protein
MKESRSACKIVVMKLKGSTVLKFILEKKGLRVWTVFSRIRIGSSGRIS